LRSDNLIIELISDFKILIFRSIKHEAFKTGLLGRSIKLRRKLNLSHCLKIAQLDEFKLMQIKNIKEIENFEYRRFPILWTQKSNYILEHLLHLEQIQSSIYFITIINTEVKYQFDFFD